MALALLLAAGGQPSRATGQVERAGVVEGRVLVEGRPIAHVDVRVRNLETAEVVATATTDQNGRFCFVDLAPGRYLVEVVNAGRGVVATSGALQLAAGGKMTATSVLINVTSAALISAAGAAPAGGFFLSTLGLVATIASAAGLGVAVVSSRPAPTPTIPLSRVSGLNP